MVSFLKIIVCFVTETNECLDNNGMCSHTCVNTPGSYHCECPTDYVLEPNLRTCKEGEYG